MSIEISLENKERPTESLAQELIYSYEALQDQARVTGIIGQIRDKDEQRRLTKQLNDQLAKVKNNKPVEVQFIKLSEFAITDPEESALAKVGAGKARQGEHLSAIETVIGLNNQLLRAQALADIGVIVDQHGLDATPVFYLALDAVRDYMNDPERDSLDMLEGIEVSEEVLKKAIKVGYFNIVREAVERTATQEGVHSDLLVSVLETYIDSLAIEKSLGLSESQIKKLSGEELANLQGLNIDSVQAALKSFRLV